MSQLRHRKCIAPGLTQSLRRRWPAASTVRQARAKARHSGGERRLGETHRRPRKRQTVGQETAPIGSALTLGDHVILRTNGMWLHVSPFVLRPTAHQRAALDRVRIGGVCAVAYAQTAALMKQVEAPA